MNRADAIREIIGLIGNNPIVSANGYISRDLFEVCDRDSNFYMIGSMGLASSIGLGIALKNKKKRVFVLDGDGNILMNLGSLATIGNLKPKNLVHVVLDNHIHDSTGGQPTVLSAINFEDMGKSANYSVFKVKSIKELKKLLKSTEKKSGPLMFIVEIKNSKKVEKRVSLEPVEIRDRFMKSLK